MAWVRLYDDIIDDPKILQLSREFRWNFVEILAISSRQNVRGTLPDVKQIAIHMRVSVGRASRIVSKLTELGFIDVNPETGMLTVHGWDKRQFESDNVTARTRAFKARQRERSRESQGNVPRNVPGTFTGTDQIQIQRQNNPPSPLPPSVNACTPNGRKLEPPPDPSERPDVPPERKLLALRNKAHRREAEGDSRGGG